MKVFGSIGLLGFVGLLELLGLLEWEMLMACNKSTSREFPQKTPQFAFRPTQVCVMLETGDRRSPFRPRLLRVDLPGVQRCFVGYL
jgi:hypothetical protein